MREYQFEPKLGEPLRGFPGFDGMSHLQGNICPIHTEPCRGGGGLICRQSHGKQTNGVRPSHPCTKVCHWTPRRMFSWSRTNQIIMGIKIATANRWPSRPINTVCDHLSLYLYNHEFALSFSFLSILKEAITRFFVLRKLLIKKEQSETAEIIKIPSGWGLSHQMTQHDFFLSLYNYRADSQGKFFNFMYFKLFFFWASWEGWHVQYNLNCVISITVLPLFPQLYERVWFLSTSLSCHFWNLLTVVFAIKRLKQQDVRMWNILLAQRFSQMKWVKWKCSSYRSILLRIQ